MKLTGFALAGLFDPSLGGNHVENLLHATCGTPDYTAPEVLIGSTVDCLCSEDKMALLQQYRFSVAQGVRVLVYNCSLIFGRSTCAGVFQPT